MSLGPKAIGQFRQEGVSPVSPHFLPDEAGAGKQGSQALEPGDKKPGPASPWLLP